MFKFQYQKFTNLNTNDVYLIFIITILSFITRFWIIHNPECVVFDEVHFGNFTNWYTKSEFFYDIHPPLGKLVMFLFANLSEYDGLIDFEKNYGRNYNDPQYIILRITPAFFSSLCAPLIYLTVRFSSFSSISSFLSSFCFIFETSLLTEQRFILSDGLLHFFTCLFLCIYSFKCSLKPFTFKWNLWLILSGISLGCSCSCKNTSWGLIGFVGFVELFQILQIYKFFCIPLLEDLTYRCMTIYLPALLIYFLSFIIHFILLPFSGQGTGYLPEEMQKQLLLKEKKSSDIWIKRISSPNLYVRIITLAVNMHYGNMGITQFHPFQSRPIGWPLLTDIFVAFWTNGEFEVNCIGNVFVYYFSVISLILNLFAFKKLKWDISLRYFIGWCLSYFPFFLIPRSMYLYHYLIPLMIGCISIGISLDLFLNNYFKGIFLILICFLILFGFYLWSPYSYGTSHFDQKFIIWNDNWINGDKVHRKLLEESRKKLI